MKLRQNNTLDPFVAKMRLKNLDDAGGFGADGADAARGNVNGRRERWRKRKKKTSSKESNCEVFVKAALKPVIHEVA